MVSISLPIGPYVVSLFGNSSSRAGEAIVGFAAVVLVTAIAYLGIKLAERVSFVLHDVFEVPFGAIATILGRSTAATKMLASRARGRIRLGTPTAATDAAAREVIDAFFAAVACSRPITPFFDGLR